MSVGEVLDVTVIEHFESGAKVRTKAGVPGFVKRAHLIDINTAEPELKYPVGTLVKAKVIQISENKSEQLPVKSKVYFTFKTKIVQSSLPIISEYRQEEVGKATIGIVSGIFPQRLFVELGSRVHAAVDFCAVPLNDDVTNRYHVGQVIQIKITELGKSKRDSSPLFIARLRDANVVKKKSAAQPWFLELKKTLRQSDDRKGKKTDLRKSKRKPNLMKRPLHSD